MISVTAPCLVLHLRSQRVCRGRRSCCGWWCCGWWCCSVTVWTFLLTLLFAPSRIILTAGCYSDGTLNFVPASFGSDVTVLDTARAGLTAEPNPETGHRRSCLTLPGSFLPEKSQVRSSEIPPRPRMRHTAQQQHARRHTTARVIYSRGGSGSGCLIVQARHGLRHRCQNNINGRHAHISTTGPGARAHARSTYRQ